MIVAHDVNLATPEGTSHINAIRHAAQEAVKGTMPAGSKLRHTYLVTPTVRFRYRKAGRDGSRTTRKESAICADRVHRRNATF
jgi:hypothetical protein